MQSVTATLRFTYLPVATKLGQGNVFTTVCLSTGGCLPQCMLEYPPPPRGPDTHPREQTPPWDQAPPPGSRLQHTVNERPVRILLECILVLKFQLFLFRNVIFEDIFALAHFRVVATLIDSLFYLPATRFFFAVHKSS